MLWRVRTFPDFVDPCLPSQVAKPPAGPDWIHEIKHDGFRLLARRGAAGVRLFTRNGHDWTERFPLIVEALKGLKVATCLIDGEAVTCDDSGLAEFDALRGRRGDHNEGCVDEAFFAAQLRLQPCDALCQSFLLAMWGHAGPIQMDLGVAPLVLRISLGQAVAFLKGRRACRADLFVSNRASDGNHGQPKSRDGRCQPKLRRSLGE